MYVTIVYVHVKPEHVADFIEAIRVNHEGSVREPGNLRFDILQSADDPTRFVAYEAYRDEAAAKAHKETPHYLAWRDRRPTGWPSRGRASATTVSSRKSDDELCDDASRRRDCGRRRGEKATTMDSKEPAEATPGRPAGEAEPAAWPGFLDRPSAADPVRQPDVRGSWARSSREFGRQSARRRPRPRLHRLVGLDAACSSRWRRRASEVALESVSGEPSPELVDAIVARHRGSGVRSPAGAAAADPIDVVVGIGGGSVLDTAKAVAGLLIPGNSVMDHLEGVGPELPYRGPSVPFVAVPDDRRNRQRGHEECGPERPRRRRVQEVVPRRGARGSGRDPGPGPAGRLPARADRRQRHGCADAAARVVRFLEGQPVHRRARSVRPGARPRRAAGPGSRRRAAGSGERRGSGAPGGAAARERMAYAALCSGICLAQAGLGAVHGLASPLGAQYPIPHGVACGATLVAATRVNIAALEERDPESRGPVAATPSAGWLFSGRAGADDREARSALVPALELLTARLASRGCRPSASPRRPSRPSSPTRVAAA